jgi:hypothetical protein
MLLGHGLRKALTTFVLAGSIGALSACAPTAGRVYVQAGPPYPVAEVRAVPPGPGYVWISGIHRWDGRAYVWSPGYWTRAPRAHATWAPGHWAHDRYGWYYVDGHWR